LQVLEILLAVTGISLFIIVMYCAMLRASKRRLDDFIERREPEIQELMASSKLDWASCVKTLLPEEYDLGSSEYDILVSLIDEMRDDNKPK